MDKFVNLHTHTHYSNSGMLDSITKTADLIKRIGELNQPAVAITDHGTVCGLIDGYNQVEKYNKENNTNIKFIFGSEFYFVDDVEIKERNYYHLVLIAKNQIGYKNLLQLTTLAAQNFYYKPRIDWSMLKQYSEGLIATSACIGGILNITKTEKACIGIVEDDIITGHKEEEIISWDRSAVVSRLNRFVDIFKDDFYIELHTNTQDKQKEFNINVLELAKGYNIPMVACVDAHYVYKNQASIHRVFVGVQENDENGYYATDDYFVMSSDEVRERLFYIDRAIVNKAISNTVIIADKCNVIINKTEKNYPVFNVDNQLERLKEICRVGWKNKIMPFIPKEQWKEYGDRANEELAVLVECDYINYFLITHDMIDWCENRAEPKIMTGVGRGSVGGSLVAYLMGITKIDPIKTGLLFSRFAHTARISPPDIDTDVLNNRRSDVIQYIADKYNGDVYHVRTFSYMQANGALKRAGQALGVSHEITNALSKEVKPDSAKYADQLSALDKVKAKDNAELIELAKQFVGVIQGYSTHASAIIVFPKNPNNWCAIERQMDSQTKQERFVASYDFHDLEEQGLLKLDILGLKTLDVIDETLKSIGNIDINNLPEDDETTFEMLKKGFTVGCFQIESSGMTGLVKTLKPKQYSDMIPLVALYRPGCLKAGMVDVFTDRSCGKQPIEYLHPLMESVLKDTYGVILYQEQIQKLANVLAGYDMGEADLLRRAVGKKLPEEMQRIKPNFISRMVEHLKQDGSDEEKEYLQSTAEKVWELIEYFGSYGFNKCLSGREKIFRAKNGHKVPTIEEMYLTKNNLKWCKDNNKMSLRKKFQYCGYGCSLSMDENNVIVANKIIDITFSGVNDVYMVITESGKTLECTLNHKIPTQYGVKLLQDIKVGEYVYVKGKKNIKNNSYNFYDKKNYKKNTPRLGQKGFQKKEGRSAWFKSKRKAMKEGRYRCYNCGIKYSDDLRFELHHADGIRKNNDNSNLLWVCNSCHKKLHYELGRVRKGEHGYRAEPEKVVSIEYVCTENTYNVEMDAPNHTIVMDSGIVVCNSHSAAYGYISYQTAYLKANYPVEYMTAKLNAYSKSAQDELLIYISEIKNMGIPILPPDINKSEIVCTVEVVDGIKSVRLGIGYIKGVGTLNYSKPITSIDDVKQAKIPKDKIEALIKSGAFDCLGDRETLFAELLDINTKIKALQEKIKTSEEKIVIKQAEIDKSKEGTEKIATLKQQIENLYSTIEKSKDKIEEINAIKNSYTSTTKIMGEKEVLGFSFVDILDCYNLKCAREPNINSTVEHIIGVELMKFRKRTQKNGKPMAFLTVRSRTKLVDLVMFNTAYKPLKEGKVYLMSIKGNKVMDASEVSPK